MNRCFSRWVRALMLVLVVLGTATCSPVRSTRPEPPAAPPVALADPPRRPGKPLVMIAMPPSESFRTVRRTLVAELTKDFDVATSIVDAQATVASFAADIERAEPSCIVLMDNPTIRLYRAYEAARSDGKPPLSAIVVMSSFLEELRDELRNASGIAYEVQGITAFVSLRSIINGPVRRVGVPHRPAFRQFIERQQALAAKEQITLVPVELPADPSASDIQKALRFLRTSGRVDALWVLNDNRLLRNAKFLETAWRHEVEALEVPVVVGIPSLVSNEAHFGTLAVLPDLEALGVQTANVIFEAADRNWQVAALPVEAPFSTLTVVNVREVREKFGLREGAGKRIDKALE